MPASAPPQVIEEHAEGGFLFPPLAAEGGATGGANHSLHTFTVAPAGLPIIEPEMVTDPVPRGGVLRAQYLRSEALDTLELPADDRLRQAAQRIEQAIQTGHTAPVKEACERFLKEAAIFYGVAAPRVRVLAVRPLRVREGGWATELFGDYDPRAGAIRVWMRTAVRHQVTSFGTLLSTLCHEFCHHLDCVLFGFPDTPHTRGFYERAAALYHHARGTPRKRLFWLPLRDGRWRIDWPRTNRGG